MKNITDDEWNQIRDAFLYNMSYYNIEECLSLFIKDYNEILNLDEECEEEESLDVYFERKMKPMWNYVYDLQKQINKIEMSKPLIPSVIAPAWQNPAIGPAYPTTYKVMCDANGNTPLGGNDASKFTPEQIEEWSNIRFDSPGIQVR